MRYEHAPRAGVPTDAIEAADGRLVPRRLQDARHEAAHAIVAAAQGWPPAWYMAVRPHDGPADPPNAPADRGYVIADPTPLHDRMSITVVGLAGVAADRYFLGIEASTVRSHEPIPLTERDPLFHFADEVARMLVRKHARAIEALADRLLAAGGYLEGQELAAAIVECMDS